MERGHRHGERWQSLRAQRSNPLGRVLFHCGLVRRFAPLNDLVNTFFDFFSQNPPNEFRKLHTFVYLYNRGFCTQIRGVQYFEFMDFCRLSQSCFTKKFCIQHTKMCFHQFLYAENLNCKIKNPAPSIQIFSFLNFCTPGTL